MENVNPMARFGGNDFSDLSVPLVFEGRYFVMEPGDPPKISVFLERDGEPVFEVLKNEPVGNDETEVTVTPPGIVTVSQRGSGKFLYKVRPGQESSAVFGALRGEEIIARITDRKIQVGEITVENNRFIGGKAGVIVRADGTVGIGCAIPQIVKQWLSSREETEK